MGVFSEIAMEQQNGMFDSSAAFEDDEAFELEEMESLPVPPVGTDTVPVSAASVCAGETALADAEEEPTDEVAPAVWRQIPLCAGLQPPHAPHAFFLHLLRRAVVPNSPPQQTSLPQQALLHP